jgi:aspartyl-tRNA(Asn)/glutamyl-tRNA(Gln) amidotransferase subunit C
MADSSISAQQVKRVAQLSRLRLDDEQVRQFADQLSVVLDYVSKLNELDVDGVEPMAHAADVTNVLRDDVPMPGMTVQSVLDNAAAKSPPFFKVPKVLGNASGA